MATPPTIANAHVYTVGASMYTGATGSCGPLGGMAFAELGMGLNLGHLPCATELWITYNGKSVLASKGDIGLGGAPVQGHVRCIDLWSNTATALGFPDGVGLVQVMRPDGKAIPGILATAAKVSSSRGSTPGGILGALAETPADPLALPDYLATGKTPITGGVSSIVDTIDSVPKFLEYITSGAFLKVVLGVVLLTVAVVEVGKKAGGPDIVALATK